MPRNKSNPNAWTPNQIVAYRVAAARQMRGWTQEHAAAELEPYLGQKLSPASFSAIERSFAGGRIRQFNADEILALSRGFGLPIGWFFTPPPVTEEIGVATPDLDTKNGEGWEPLLLIDAILGDEDTIPEWEEALRTWSVRSNRIRVHTDGDVEDLRDGSRDVHERIDTFLKARARVRLGDLLGDVDRAKDVLAGLVGVLDELDDVEGLPAAVDDAARAGTDEHEEVTT